MHAGGISYWRGVKRACDDAGVEFLKIAHALGLSKLADPEAIRRAMAGARPREGYTPVGAYQQSRWRDPWDRPTGSWVPVYEGAHRSTFGERVIDGLQDVVIGGHNQAIGGARANSTALKTPLRMGGKGPTRNYERGWFGRMRPVSPLHNVQRPPAAPSPGSGVRR